MAIRLCFAIPWKQVFLPWTARAQCAVIRHDLMRNRAVNVRDSTIFGQRPEGFQAALDYRIVSRVREAEMRIAATEDIAWNYQQSALDGPGDELACRAPRDFGEGVERTCWMNQLKF